jgi:hypothetical protein
VQGAGTIDEQRHMRDLQHPWVHEEEPLDQLHSEPRDFMSSQSHSSAPAQQKTPHEPDKNTLFFILSI